MVTALKNGLGGLGHAETDKLPREARERVYPRKAVAARRGER